MGKKNTPTPKPTTVNQKSYSPEDADRIIDKHAQAAKILFRAKQASRDVMGDPAVSDEEKRRLAREQAEAKYVELCASHSWTDCMGESPNGLNQPRLKLYPERLDVELDGQLYPVTERRMEMLQVLYEAEGEWIGGKIIGGRPDKLCNDLGDLRRIIETDKAKGYRIKPEYFA